MIKFVWDTSAIINIKEADETGYSPSHSLYKDFSDGWINKEYLNIFPTIAIFEIAATVSKKHRKGINMLREFYLLGENSTLYDIDSDLISKTHELFTLDGFDKLYGADLVFACIAHLENAYLVTLDNKLALHTEKHIKVINLNESRDNPNYRRLFE